MRKIVRMQHTPQGPTKTVTIRGVNQELYERFSSLSSQFGDNTGQIFSHLISGFGKQYHPFLLQPGLRKQMVIQDSNYSVEVIADLNELILSKNDLIEAGENIRYFFRNVESLVFDESVDNKVLMNHVLGIRNSSVTTKGDVSKLFLKSINQGKNRDEYFADLDSTTTNVTIRNVSEDAYNEFTATCQTKGLKIGEAVTNLLKRALPHFEISQIMIHDNKINPVDTIVLTMHAEISVQNRDLLDLENRKVLFHRIKSLHFSSDVQKEQFLEKVIGIYNCDFVDLPDSVPKLIRHSRIHTYP